MARTATYTAPLLSLLLLMCALPTRSQTPGCAQARDNEPADAITTAHQWCDTAALDNFEGIWLLPADQVYMLVRRSSRADMASYTLTVLAATDGQFAAGQPLGTLSPMPDRKTYLVSLPFGRDSQDRLRLRNVRMQLSTQGDALVAAPGNKTVRFSFSPLSLLPGFWRMMRLTVSPDSRQPIRGMVRVYPGYDLNGSDRLTPRYF